MVGLDSMLTAFISGQTDGYHTQIHKCVHPHVHEHMQT